MIAMWDVSIIMGKVVGGGGFPAGESLIMCVRLNVRLGGLECFLATDILGGTVHWKRIRCIVCLFVPHSHYLPLRLLLSLP